MRIVPMAVILVGVFGLLEMWKTVLALPGRIPDRTCRIGMAAAGVVLTLALIGQSAVHFERFFSNYASETSMDFHYGFDEAIMFAAENQSIYNEIWVAHVNEPYIYLLFNEKIDPYEARLTMDMVRGEGDYNWVRQYDNFFFTPRIWFDPPNEIDLNTLTTVFQSFDPNGDVAYEVRSGEVPGRGLTMVIFKPEWLATGRLN